MSISGEPTLGAVPKEVTTRNELGIVSPKERDSLNGIFWKKYLDSSKLLNAWSSPDGSPFSYYQKFKTINSIDKYSNTIKPRYSEGEINSEIGIINLINGGILDSSTAVILNSGGPHSVAMAVKLAEIGYQPVVMFDSEPNVNGTNKSGQELATMLYFAEQMKSIKEKGVIKSGSPPVFIMDTHRADNFEIKGFIYNGYSFNSSDLPSTEELRHVGIKKVVYLNEGDQNGLIDESYQSIDRVEEDLKDTIDNWQSSGIEMIYTGVRPWKSTPEINYLITPNGFGNERPKVFYPDMKPSIYGENNGIAMHINRERYILTNEGKLQVIDESGHSRSMKSNEISRFKTETEQMIDSATGESKKALSNLFRFFPN